MYRKNKKRKKKKKVGGRVKKNEVKNPLMLHLPYPHATSRKDKER